MNHPVVVCVPNQISVASKTQALTLLSDTKTNTTEAVIESLLTLLLAVAETPSGQDILSSLRLSIQHEERTPGSSNG